MRRIDRYDARRCRARMVVVTFNESYKLSKVERATITAAVNNHYELLRTRQALFGVMKAAKATQAMADHLTEYIHGSRDVANEIADMALKERESDDRDLAEETSRQTLALALGAFVEDTFGDIVSMLDVPQEDGASLH